MEFSSWKRGVDKVLSVYSNKVGTVKYFGILCAIHNKIVGSADRALAAYNIQIN